METKSLSPNVKALISEMEASNKSQTDVASETKISIATIYRYISGTTISRHMEHTLMTWVSDSKEARNGN